MNTLHSILTRFGPLRRRSIGPHADDVFLVSYPRSGNTWVRTIIAHMLFPADRIQRLSDLDVLVPDMERGLPPFSNHGSFRVIKTHHAFATRQYRKKHDYGRIIYVVRHPYDVVRSFYDYLREINPAEANVSFRAFVDDFVRGSVWPCSWQEHVLSWYGAPGDRRFLCIRYEDLRDDPVRETNRIAHFLDHPLASRRVTEIVALSSRANMVELNRKGPLVRKDYDFIRRTDDRRKEAEEVTPELKAIIDVFCAPALRVAGYESDNR